MGFRIDRQLRERINRLRRRAGLTGPDLADAAQIDKKTELKIRSGRAQQVQEKTLHQIAMALDISFSQLIGDEPIADFDHIHTREPHPPLPNPQSRRSVSRRWSFRRVSRVLVPVAAFLLTAFIVWQAAQPKDRRSIPEALSRLDIPTCSTKPCLRYYSEGMDHLRDLRCAEARASFLQAVECDSTFAMGYAMLLHPDMWRSIEERAEYNALATKFSASCSLEEKIFINALCVWHDEGPVEAIEAFEQVVAIKASAMTYRLLGRLYMNIRNSTKSLGCYELAVALDPSDGMSYNRLAYLYALLGRKDDAFAAADMYIALEPNEPNPFDTKGDLLVRFGSCQDAMDFYRRALTRDASFQPSIQSLGCICLLHGETDQAEEYYRRLLAFEDPETRSRAHFFLACIPVFLDDSRSAIDDISRAISIDELEERFGVAYFWKLRARAMLKCSSGQLNGAISDYETLVSDCVRFREAELVEWLPGLICLLAQRDVSEAEDRLQPYLDEYRSTHKRNDQYLWRAKGWIEYYRQNYGGAVDLFERAAEDNENIEFWYPLALAYLGDGRTSDGRDILNRILAACSADRVVNASWSKLAEGLFEQL